MTPIHALLACPVCRGGLDRTLACRGCSRAWTAPDGIVRLRLDVEGQTDVVRRFYNDAPIPAIRRTTPTWLRARAERSAFARLLDAAIPGDARIVEVGCGTGQISLYLARADRVVALDLSRGALLASAPRRPPLRRGPGHFVECDIARLPLRTARSTSSTPPGVLHHTPIRRRPSCSIAARCGPAAMSSSGCTTATRGIPLRFCAAWSRG